jgi:hypothetical protein
MPSPKKPREVDSKVSNRRQNILKDDPCVQITQRRQETQRTFAAKEMVSLGGTYLKKMKTQKKLLFLVERK